MMDPTKAHFKIKLEAAELELRLERHARQEAEAMLAMVYAEKVSAEDDLARVRVRVSAWDWLFETLSRNFFVWLFCRKEMRIAEVFRLTAKNI